MAFNWDEVPTSPVGSVTPPVAKVGQTRFDWGDAESKAPSSEPAPETAQAEKPLPAPQGPVGTFFHSAAPKVIPGLFGLGGAVGGGALGGLVTSPTIAGIPVGVAAGATAGGVGGEKVGGWVNHKLAKWMFTPEYLEAWEAQNKANEAARPLTAASGEMLGGAASMFAGGGALGKIPKVAEEIGIGRKLIESGISGAVMTGGSEAQDPNSTVYSTTKAAIRGGVTMAPLAFVPEAKTILGSVGWRGPADAAILAVNNALYDHFTAGKPINPEELAKQTGKDIPSFMLMNAIMGVFGRQPLLKPAIDKIAAAKTPDEVIKDPVSVKTVLSQAGQTEVPEPEAAPAPTQRRVRRQGTAPQPPQEAATAPISPEAAPVQPSSTPETKPVVEPSAPPAVATTPFEQISPDEKIMYPVVVTPEGRRYYGNHHEEAIADSQANGETLPKDDEPYRLFETTRGNLVDRMTGAAMFKRDTGMDTERPGQLHSEDLERARKAATNAIQETGTEQVPGTERQDIQQGASEPVLRPGGEVPVETGTPPAQVEAAKPIEAKPKRGTVKRQVQEPTIIPVSKDLKIVNMDSVARGTGARYLEVTRGQGDDLVAKQWRRTPVKGAILVDYRPEPAQQPEPRKTVEPAPAKEPANVQTAPAPIPETPPVEPKPAIAEPSKGDGQAETKANVEGKKKTFPISVTGPDGKRVISNVEGEAISVPGFPWADSLFIHKSDAETGKSLMVSDSVSGGSVTSRKFATKQDAIDFLKKVLPRIGKDEFEKVRRENAIQPEIVTGVKPPEAKEPEAVVSPPAGRKVKRQKTAQEPIAPEAPVTPTIVTDPARVQEIKNSIAEGQLILRAGTSNGRKLSKEQLLAVRMQVERDLAKIGESRIAGKTVGVKMTDVTPEGYGPTEPAVETTSQGVRVKTKPNGEKTISVPKKDKEGIAPKEQKKYLLAELDKAIADAPEKQAEISDPKRDKELAEEKYRLLARRKELDNDWNKKHGDERRAIENRLSAIDIPKRDKELAEEKYRLLARHKELYHGDERHAIENRLSAINIERGELTDRVRIEVPGDGIFILKNEKASLKDFQKKAAKQFPVTPVRADSVGRAGPASVPSIGKVEKPQDWAGKENEAKKLLEPFQSREPTREVQNQVHYNAERGEVVATDGPRLAVIPAEKQASRKEPGWGLATEKGIFPDYAQAFPGYREGQVPKVDPDSLHLKGVETESLIRKLRQAKFVSSDKSNDVALYVNEKGGIDVVENTPDVGEYDSRQSDKVVYLGAFNPEYVIDALNLVRKTGDANVDIAAAGKNSPFLFMGKKAYSVLMPLRLSPDVQFTGLKKQYEEMMGISKPEPEQAPSTTAKTQRQVKSQGKEGDYNEQNIVEQRTPTPENGERDLPRLDREGRSAVDQGRQEVVGQISGAEQGSNLANDEQAGDTRLSAKDGALEDLRPSLDSIEVPKSLKQFGYEDPEAFKNDYREKGQHDLGETPEEFLRRQFCEGFT